MGAVASECCVSRSALAKRTGGSKPGRPSGFEVISLEDGSTHVRPQKLSEIADIKARSEKYTVDPDGKLEIPLATEGPAGSQPTTLIKMFKTAAEKYPDAPALRHEEGDEGFAVTTWAEYYEASVRAAKSFIHLGLPRHGTVSIIGFNSEEWFISEMGAMLAGGKAAGIYTTNAPKDCAYIVSHSESRVVVCENDKQLAKFLAVKADLTSVKAIVVYKGEVPEGASTDDMPVYSWSEFLALGTDAGDALEDRMAGVEPGHACLLIYTSGTTGNPKAVMISHDNAIFQLRTLKTLRIMREAIVQGEVSLVSYLPLSHVAGNFLDCLFAMILTSEVPDSRGLVTFARPDALKGSLKVTLGKVQPTFFFGVPRVWEKFMEAMIKAGQGAGGMKKHLVDWAKSEGQCQFEMMTADVSDNGFLAVDESQSAGLAMAQKMVLSKVWAALGMTRCSKFCLTGAAPVSKATLDFFGAVGIHIHEVYGMSESSASTTCSDIGTRTPLCCGCPVPGTELLIQHDKNRDKPGEGEICFRGRHIMMGYMKDRAKTAEAIDPEGWLHSGDVGRVDAAGRLYITGRIKELIITAGGENIAPVPIEDAMKELMPGIANCMVVGDRRKYNVLLVCLHHEIDETGMPTSKLGPQTMAIPGTEAKDIEAALTCEAIKKYLEEGIKRYNKERALSNAQNVQYFRVVPRDFSVGGGELTPTLKLKRPVVLKTYEQEIESMYSD